MIKAILFDLDDTLYAERDYVVSGYRVVAEAIAAGAGLPHDAVWRHMVDRFDDQGRAGLFDETLAWAGLPARPQEVESLVAAYRRHRPAISLAPDVEALLSRLRQRYRLAVVTDGLATMQRNKVAALGLAALVDEIVYCWDLDAPKPDPEGYRAALRTLDCAAEEALVVGDRPDHDMTAARALGIASVRVRTPRFADRQDDPLAPPLITIEGPLALEAALETLAHETLAHETLAHETSRREKTDA